MKVAAGAVALLLAGLAVAPAQHGGVASTLHNLSASGHGGTRASEETEVCRFCHIPHNAVVATPLWGHAVSKVDRYSVPTLSRGPGIQAPAPQPDGSSRLCLSCHDGTVALGDLGRGRVVPMAGPARLERGMRGQIGTDLSGSHPVSLVVPDGDLALGRDIGIKPLAQIRAQDGVRLDEAGKMQCTTCHDPHSDRYYVPGRVPRFWVRPTITEVCLACHEAR